jgi:PAS domain S-box-containing protein
MAADLAGLAWWDWDLQTGELFWSDRRFVLCGYTPGAVNPSHAAWAAAVHPEDLPRVEAAIERARATGGRYACQYRYRHADGRVIWVEERGECCHGRDGVALRLAGAAVDITERKAAEAQRELLTRELRHRVKNLFMVVQSVALTSLRSAASLQAFEGEFLGRLQSLARAHQLLTGGASEGAPLADVLRGELEAYDDGSRRRVAVESCEALLGPEAALAVALATHELATNAVKHGALSVPEGQVRVSCHVEDGGERAQVLWQEAGGPAVRPPTRRGFGTRMLDALGQQAGGELALEFAPEGLVCRIRLPLRRTGGEAAGLPSSGLVQAG